MASWLGLLGSGLGGSLGQVAGSVASFTGQTSNITKVVLRKVSEQGHEDVPASNKNVEGSQKLQPDGCTCCQRGRPGKTSRCECKTLRSM
uniref:Uncharacterized protein n=1 Tax=Catagonus wagneri TaxID=51154 RepID=A0A8C3WYM1_9CETA